MTQINLYEDKAGNEYIGIIDNEGREFAKELKEDGYSVVESIAIENDKMVNWPTNRLFTQF